MTEATTHEIEIRRMMIDCRILIATLEKERKSNAVWTIALLTLAGANLYFLARWPTVKPLWFAAGGAAMNLIAAERLLTAIYRYWRQWLVAWRACRQMFDLLQRLARYHGYSDPANHPR